MRYSFIYGLFDSVGICLYVGQTVNLKKRWQSHRRDRFQDIICSMRPLRMCSTSEANRLEVQVILAYRKKGQAGMNRTLTAFGRPLLSDDQKACEYIIVRVNDARKAAYKRAAKAAGKTLTAWAFSVCDKASGHVEDQANSSA